MPRNAKENPREVLRVNFEKLLPIILQRVACFGDVVDIRSWKKAFPECEFMEIDREITGKSIKWEERSALERAVYVAYMYDPQRVMVGYRIDADGYEASYETNDSEIIWNLWFYGALRGLEEGAELEEEAREALLTYVARQQGGAFEELIMDQIPANRVTLEGMVVWVAPLAVKIPKKKKA